MVRSKEEIEMVKRMYENGLSSNEIRNIIEKTRKLKYILKKTTITQNYGKDVWRKIIDKYNSLESRLKDKFRHTTVKLIPSTYMVLREMGVDVSLYDVAISFKNDIVVANKLCRKIYPIMPEIFLQDTETWVKRCVNWLKLPKGVEKSALKFLEENGEVLKKFSPLIAAATCVYLQAEKYGKKMDLKEMAKTLKINKKKSFERVISFVRNNCRMPDYSVEPFEEIEKPSLEQI
ncbi:MAG: hypothetical protein QW040_04035 [Candidatus Aenigmatarchaeota archaeon]